MAELMLRRTRADQVVPVYRSFLSSYPDIVSLMHAKSEHVDGLTASLGLHWRRDAFQLVAKDVMEQYGGKIPDSRVKLLQLSGVGDYVAGAVLSCAYHKKEWIVDTNVVRIFKRFLGIETSKEGRRDRLVIELAKMYADCARPKEANLALLDFAALVCTARKPEHDTCPLLKKCQLMI